MLVRRADIARFRFADEFVSKFSKIDAMNVRLIWSSVKRLGVWTAEEFQNGQLKFDLLELRRYDFFDAIEGSTIPEITTFRGASLLSPAFLAPIPGWA